MKVLYLLLILCILGIYAQRRPASRADAVDSETSSQRPVSRSRGRTRFSITPEFEQASADYEAVTKDTRKQEVPRRKVENVKATPNKRLPRPTKESGPKSRPYEVKEVVDDIPREDSRRINKKPRVVTESRFEAINAPKKDLFIAAPSTPDEFASDLAAFATPAVPEGLPEETALPAQLTTLPINAIPSTEKSVETNLKGTESLDAVDVSDVPKADTELKRKQIEPAPTPKLAEPRRPGHGRANLRTRGNSAAKTEEATSPPARVRARTKPLRKPEDQGAPAAPIPSLRAGFRPGRRRGEAVAESIQEPVRTRGPSVFAAESAQESPSRLRPGRKVSSGSERRIDQRTGSEGRSRGGRINSAATTTTTSAPEKVDLNLSRRTDARSSTSAPEQVDVTINRRTEARSTSSAPERVDLNLSRRTETRRGNTAPEKLDLHSNRRTDARSSSSTPTPVDSNLSRRPDLRRRSKFVEPSTEESIPNKGRTSSKEAETRSSRRGASRATTPANTQSTTHQNERQSRGRVRSRSFLTLNEQKLEVLPLFETEPKTVLQSYGSVTVPSRTSLGRRRSLNSAEDIDTASTKESEIKVEVDPIHEELESSTPSNIRVSRQQSISVETKTEKAIRKVYKKLPYQRSKPTRKSYPPPSEPKESVSVSEVSEVVATRKFRPANARRNHAASTGKEETKKNEDSPGTKQTIKVDEPKVSFRQVVRKGSKKLAPKGTDRSSTELTTSQEEIGEADNYPIPYKAALQAKKHKKEGLGSRSAQPSEVSVTKSTQDAAISSIVSSLESSASSKAPVAENAVKDEETDHKSEAESTTIAPATKFPRPRFSLTSKQPKPTEKPSETTVRTGTSRAVYPSRKYKPKPKALTTTTLTPTTEEGQDETTGTTTSPLQKFHARFKSSRSQKDKGPEVHITPRTAHKSRSYSPKAPKGLYSSRKLSRSSTTAPETEETEKPRPKFNVETSALSTKVPPTGLGIKKASRFSSRYRSDLLSRSAAAHRTSTAGPQYVPTVPTVTPPPTSVKVEENELGMEIISFDDPVANTVPSDNLISGDYLSSSPPTKTDPSAVETKSATTEKPVSIIERIINSISSMTTTSPDATTKTSSTTGGQSTKSSAILSLVSKRPKDKTVTIDLPLESGSQKLTNSPNSVAFGTTEKPTTVIEKILSSLSAIRADTTQEPTTVEPVQVGSNYNTVDSNLKISATESTSTVAKPTVPMSKGTSATALPLISQSTVSPPASTASSSSTSNIITTLDFATSSDISTIPIGTSSISPRSISFTTPLSSQTSTTLDPTNGLEEIISDQTLPKRTIDKLLSLLNIVSPTTTTTVQPSTTQLVIVTPKLTTFVTSNTEPINTELTATPVPTTLPTTSDAVTTSSSVSDTTTPMLFTSTLKTPENSANEINSFVNPLSSEEPNSLSSRLLDVISRIMGTTLMPTTTVSSTSGSTTFDSTVTPTAVTNPTGTGTSAATETSVGVTTAGTASPSATPTLAETTPVATTLGMSSLSTNAATGTTVVGSTPTETLTTVTVAATSESSVASTTPVSTGMTTASGTPMTITIPITTITQAASTTPVPAANPLAVTTPGFVSSTAPITTTDASIGSTIAQTNPSVTLTTSQTPASTMTLSTAGISTTIASPTTIQSTTSTQTSVVEGPISTTPFPSPSSTTEASATQTSSTLLTTVNTTPGITSTAGSSVTVSTSPQTEVTSTSTGSTGASVLTSTTKVTRETTTDSTLDAPTTLPTLANFEVSPDRVSVFSANDISSTFVPDDPGTTTVSISGRSFSLGPTISSSVETTASNTVSTTPTTISTSQPTVGTTSISSTATATTPQSTSTGIPSTALPTTNIVSSTSTVTTTSPVNNSSVSGSTAASSTSTSSPIMTTTSSVNSARTTADATTQDVSSNTIDTSSVTDKQPLVNQTDASNLVNPLSAGTNVSVAGNSSMSSGMSVSTPLPDNSKPTVTRTMSLKELMGRTGKLLEFEPNALQNDIQGASPMLRDKDYFIFAVLPNNTILRKRPSMYPTKETPFLIYGVLPNNTLVQKFPNGTIVPMEPTIQVIGFDTRENPPRPPEIISNQVTPEQESRPDNNIVSTVAQTQPNDLSLNGGSSAGGQPNSLPPLTGRTVNAFNTIVNQTNADTQTPNVQTLDVDPKIQPRVNVENVEINTISSASSSPPPPPEPSSPSTTNAPTTTAAPAPTTTPAPVLTTSASTTTTAAPVSTTTTSAATTTPSPAPATATAAYPPPGVASTTTAQPLPLSTSSPAATTAGPTNPPQPPSTTPAPRVPSTTGFPSTTYFPTFLTTLFSTLQPQRDTTVTPTSSLPPTSTIASVTTTTKAPFTSPQPDPVNPYPNPLSVGSDSPSTTGATVPTLMDILARGGFSSSTPLPATVLSTTVATLQNINLKQAQLTEQQKQDLATLQALEKEQAAILRQLAFLTGLNVEAVSPPKKENDNLADRVIAMAMERLKGNDKSSSSTNLPPAFNLLETLSPKDSRQSKSIAVAPSVQELVKQINANGLNSVTPPGPIVTSTYGKTNDALLASLLKEYGVGPNTPKVLSGAFDSTTSAPKPTTTKRSVTTQAPNRLMQGLTWLLNTLAPSGAPRPTPKRPQPKPKPKPKSLPVDDELLSKQPTEITPVIVDSPADQPAVESKTENNVVSQKDLATLIKQLEEFQKDPKNAKNLDVEILKTIQNLQKAAPNSANVQVITASSTGATSRSFVTGTPKISSTKAAITDNEVKQSVKFTTPLPLSLRSNILSDVPGVEEDLEAARTKTKIPPVELNPVPGVPAGNPRIQGQLVNYAINVTKAISSFLGSALQGVTDEFVNNLSTGNGNLSHLFSSATNSSSV